MVFIKFDMSYKQKNKAVQIHKLLNPKPNAPKYYTENDLANDLAHWFNNFRGDSAVIAPNFFIGDVAKIDLIGTIFGNAQVRMFKGKEIKKLKFTQNMLIVRVSYQKLQQMELIKNFLKKEKKSMSAVIIDLVWLVIRSQK